MSMTDPIADMLTRIRNGCMAKKPLVTCPASKLKQRILEVLTSEGYIEGFNVGTLEDRAIISITLKYSEDDRPVINGIKRVSKPGLRRYARTDAIPTVRNGLGLTILSTSKGIMTDRQARKENVGGEMICSIW